MMGQQPRPARANAEYRDVECRKHDQGESRDEQSDAHDGGISPQNTSLEAIGIDPRTVEIAVHDRPETQDRRLDDGVPTFSAPPARPRLLDQDDRIARDHCQQSEGMPNGDDEAQQKVTT